MEDLIQLTPVAPPVAQSDAIFIALDEPATSPLLIPLDTPSQSDPSPVPAQAPSPDDLLFPKTSDEPVPSKVTYRQAIDLDDPLLDFSNIPPPQPAETVSQPPAWVLATTTYIRNLVAVQPSIVIHRSKLYALFDVFRALLKDFDPDYSLPQPVLKQTCALLIETINKTRQVVLHCSGGHWSQTAITWPLLAVKDAVHRIRLDISECLTTFCCKKAPDFLITDEDLSAEDAVDAMQLKGSLLHYIGRMTDQPVTAHSQRIAAFIEERLRSIGPVEGFPEGPPLVSVPPFLSSELNLVLTQDDFTTGEAIGSGSFGRVHVGTLTNGRKVAVKVLNAQLLGGRQLETFKREVWTMSTLNHPSILKLLGVTLTAPFAIVTELHKCSLYERLKNLSASKRSAIAFRVSQAMEHLHAARIIHRDLKSGNILLDEDDMPHVCDFGLVGFKVRGTRTGYVGTAQWMAPEVLRSSPFYDEKVDVYSFGVLLWELLTQAEPYPGMTQDQIVMAIIERGARPAIPPHCGPPKLIELINKCWAEKPADRPSFPQVTAALTSPEVHFAGTDESVFEMMSPHQLLSTHLVHAFDEANWTRWDDLISSITREAIETDPEIINVLISLFAGIPNEKQANIVRALPRNLDFQQFLCMRGYGFIVSLFSCDGEVIDATVEALRTLPLSSKGFRQVMLVSSLARSKNQRALDLCADLCEFKDIAEHIVAHDLPFTTIGMDLPLIRIYGNLLAHATLRDKVSHMGQLFAIAAAVLNGNEAEICGILLNCSFAQAVSAQIVETNLIPELCTARNVTEIAAQVLRSILAVSSPEQLMRFKGVIDGSSEPAPLLIDDVP